ncbi:MAG: SOS response-associated peptidase [Bacteroidales bacterium]|nr:SOS response-associated peptidase [Bacteroidales bacterium]MDZ4205062.1 SOS response-associated peptidase [Bacteroidales bacterium]
MGYIDFVLMCGRFSLTTDEEILNERFRLAGGAESYVARYNCAPTQMLAVVPNADPGRISYFRWGLIPFWAKDISIGNKLINARAETILEKPAFRNAFRTRRCLVLSDGFFEWKKSGKLKVPYYITLQNHEPFAMAGIWETWEDKIGVSFRSFSIITTAANDLMQPLHNRMPVILNPEDEPVWLERNYASGLQALLKPFPSNRLKAYRVSVLINSPRNDSPDIIVYNLE